MDFERGIVLVEGTVFGPGYTFRDFCHSPFYKNQDGVRIIYLDGMIAIDGNHYIVSLFFRTDQLYSLSLICCDKAFTPETENERKELHDEILKNYCIAGEKEFWWGKVASKYDQRSNLSSISFYFNT